MTSAPCRFLLGDRLTEADLRLFATLIRFDEVYYVHFKTNKKLIRDYPNLSNVRRGLMRCISRSRGQLTRASSVATAVCA